MQEKKLHKQNIAFFPFFRCDEREKMSLYDIKVSKRDI
jgi:hypothetical protein